MSSLSVNQIVEWLAVLLILDVYTRSHAATKSATLSVLTCLLGAFIYFWSHDGFFSIRLILGIIFVFITAPVAGHLVCRAAYRSRVPLAEGSGEDMLKPVLFGEELSVSEKNEESKIDNDTKS